MTPILFIAFAAYLLLALKDRRAAFLLLIAALPTYLIRFNLVGVPTTALEVLFWIFFWVWFFRREKRFIDIGGWRLILLCWLIAATVACFVAPDLRAAAGVWKAYFVVPILFFIIANDLLRKEEDRLAALKALAFAAIAVAGAAVLQRLTGAAVPPDYDGVPPSAGEVEDWRATAFYGYPNAIGLFLAPLVPLFFHRRDRLLNVAGALSVLSVLLACSEGAILGIAAGLFFMAVMMPKLRKSAALAALAIALLIFAIPATRQLFIQKATLSDWSGEVRKVIWAESWDMLKDRPVLGAGLSAYPTALKPYHQAGHLEIFQYPHQLILNFWSELGFLGLFVLGWTLCRFFRTPGHLPLKAAMIAVLVHGLVDVPYFKNDLAMLFWLLIALMASAEAEARKKLG